MFHRGDGWIVGVLDAVSVREVGFCEVENALGVDVFAVCVCVFPCNVVVAACSIWGGYLKAVWGVAEGFVVTGVGSG